MTGEGWLNVLAPLILGGGLITALNSVWQAKKKVPAERDAIAVTGAETAVMSISRALDAAEARAVRAEAEANELRARVQALEERLVKLQKALDETRDELHSILEKDTKGDLK